MSPLFEKNVSALRKFHPGLARTVENLPEDGRATLARARSGHPALVAETDRGPVAVHSIEDPVAEAMDFLGANPVRHPKIVFCLGFGLGYHVIKFLQGVPAGTEHLVIVEKNPHFFRLALEIHDLEPLFENPRVQWHVGVAASELREAVFQFLLPTKMLYYVRAIDLLAFPPCLDERISGNYYQEVLAALQEGLEFRIRNSRSHPEDGLMGLHNLLRNSRRVYESFNIDALQGAFKGLPGVVIGSGPSLTGALPHLDGINDRAVVACVASAARKLIQAGKDPHVIAALERGEMPASLVKELGSKPLTRLVAPPLIDEENYEYFGGEVITILRQLFLFEWFPSPFKLHFFGGSSGTLALHLLIWFGCDPIILIGQDLAFREDGESHASGIHDGPTRDYADGIKRGDYIFWEKQGGVGNSGLPVATTYDWLGNARTFERSIQSAGVRCINAIDRGSGLLIPGTTRMDVVDALKYCPQDIEGEIRRRFEMHLKKMSPAEVDSWEEKFRHHLQETHRGLLNLINECSPGRPLPSRELYGRYQSLHEGNPAKTLLYDIIFSLDLDLMTPYYELERKGFEGEALEGERVRLLENGFAMTREWAEKVLSEIKPEVTPMGVRVPGA